GRHMIVALGIGCDGRKMVLGLREGATENAAVVGELLSDLLTRGLDFTQPRLYVLDGSKALHSAVQKHAGDAALVQRCQVHKRRNALDHLPEEHQNTFGTKLNNAYAMFEYDDAKRALDKIHHELMHLNPSAARSLEEGMAETLTVHKLRIPVKLRKTLSSTNVIESAFSVVEIVCRNVKRWRGGDHVHRRVGSGLLVAEGKFRRVKGYQEIPQLMDAMITSVSKKGVTRKVGAV
ncbi:MAG: transposase, partial [Acidobacteriota bacterium]|nr:transposase [Acidobacteriota bacterium]